MPYPSALEVCSRRGAIQIHIYLYLTFTFTVCKSALHFQFCCILIFPDYQPKLQLGRSCSRLRNGLKCAEWDVKPGSTMLPADWPHTMDYMHLMSMALNRFLRIVTTFACIGIRENSFNSFCQHWYWLQHLWSRAWTVSHSRQCSKTIIRLSSPQMWAH